jgi:peroxiredoxin
MIERFIEKRKMKLYLHIISLLISLTSLSQKPVNYEIDGHIQGLKNDSIFILISHSDENGKRIKTDTVIGVSKNDHFHIKGTLAGSRYVWASIGGGRNSRSFSFFIEEGKITITADIENLDNISVTGTASNNDQTSSRRITNAIYNRIKALRLQLKGLAPEMEEHKIIMGAINAKFDSIQSYEIRFIETHPNSMFSSTYLYVLQDKLPLKKLENLYGALSNDVKNSAFGSIVREKIKARKLVAIGNKAPEFSSFDTSGNDVSLASFRGKYVLLEVWASWCVPCRQQSPHLVEMNKKYGDKNFAILQYSIDDKKAEQKWKEAIRQDGLTWTQISDLSGFENKVSKLYGVQPIPDNFLIDPNGKIIGRRLEGKELEEKLKELIR